MNIMAESNLVHDPNYLKPETTCLHYKTTEPSRLNITSSYTLHVQNSGDGFVNKIATKIFIPAGLMTPSYIDIAPPVLHQPPVEMQTGINAPVKPKSNNAIPPILSGVNTETVKESTKEDNTNTQTNAVNDFKPPLYHGGSLSVSEQGVDENSFDKRIKIDTISVHGAYLIKAPFYITKVDSLFNLPSEISHISITAEYSHPFLNITIKNENTDGTDPLLYAYQEDTVNITAEIKFSLQTTRRGPNEMMSWSSVNFNDDDLYYTQPALVYITSDSTSCSCIKYIPY